MRKIDLLSCLLHSYLALGASIPNALPSMRLALPSLLSKSCVKLSPPWKNWVLPSEARDCMSAFSFKEEKRQNILDVVTRTLAFHASTNYQLQAPYPFDKDIHWDLLGDLEGMRSKSYANDLEFHVDVRRSLRKANDGHLMYTNGCYDGVYITYNPLPLVLLTDPSNGSQAIYISPNAHEITFSLFGKEVKFWEDALGRPLKEFSGARIVRIDGEDPFVAVNGNAQTTGSFQGLSSRQNSFFSTAIRGEQDWIYTMGDFAEKDLPIVDFVQLVIQRVGADVEESITVPYRSKFNKQRSFPDQFFYEDYFCRATKFTNGPYPTRRSTKDSRGVLGPKRRVLGARATAPVLPDTSKPLLTPLKESSGSTQFYTLNSTTGVLVIGSFEDDEREEDAMKCTFYQGLQKMHRLGVRNLIIDLTGNEGGYACHAAFLHRLLLGETEKTVPQAGLDTAACMPGIAQGIVENTPRTRSSNGYNLYDREWRNATHQIIEDEAWYNPVQILNINGRRDVFSQRLGMECDTSSKICKGTERLGADPLFSAENIILLSNGRCGSSCAVFSVLLAKKHGVRTVVVGGKADVPQQYCGFVGGETVNFKDIDETLKTTGLKQKDTNSLDIPPDLIVNAVVTVTWRLAYGVNNPNEPEEWQNHTATVNLPLTADMAHKPQKIWEAVAKEMFPVVS